MGKHEPIVANWIRPSLDSESFQSNGAARDAPSLASIAIARGSPVSSRSPELCLLNYKQLILRHHSYRRKAMSPTLNYIPDYGQM